MNELQTTIYELETSLLKPEIRSSFENLNELLTEDFKEFGTSGSIYTKQDILTRLPSSTNTDTYIVSDFNTKLLSSDIVIANFKTEKIINDTQKVVSLRTSLWRKENDNWKMFFHQGTPTK